MSNFPSNQFLENHLAVCTSILETHTQCPQTCFQNLSKAVTKDTVQIYMWGCLSLLI